MVRDWPRKKLNLAPSTSPLNTLALWKKGGRICGRRWDRCMFGVQKFIQVLECKKGIIKTLEKFQAFHSHFCFTVSFSPNFAK
jgi:hypothetical protein